MHKILKTKNIFHIFYVKKNIKLFQNRNIKALFPNPGIETSLTNKSANTDTLANHQLPYASKSSGNVFYELQLKQDTYVTTECENIVRCMTLNLIVWECTDACWGFVKCEMNEVFG